MTNSPLDTHMPLLKAHRERLEGISLRDLFADAPRRFEAMSVTIGSLLFDYSKNRLDQDAIVGLVALASDVGLEARRDAMFGGDKINTTEQRAVLHTALRNVSGDAVIIDGHDVMPDIREVVRRMGEFSDAVRGGSYQPSGKAIKDVVNIGIGGSDLGPKMAVEALGPYCDGPAVHFVSNVDGADITDTLTGLDPASTLFIVASKTFTTQETMANAQAALAWATNELGTKSADHFAALSTNLEATSAFGIPAERTFGFWDWVGGRYSVWSAIGLSLMMAIGKDRFQEFLSGAHAADVHFKTAPLAGNIPVLMALIGIWHRNVCGYASQAVLPYDNRMGSFPRWLQQLDMESNGKSAQTSGERVKHATGPIIFGEPGTNGQHAFYQLIHQGTDIIPCDFLVAANGHESSLDNQHQLLVANCLAQSQALAFGRSLEEASGDPHRAFDGNRPSSTFLYEKLDPHTLGMLMALYEHKVFVQGTVWNINSFDQWGVELGKELAKKLEPSVGNASDPGDQDASTKGLLGAFHNFRR